MANYDKRKYKCPWPGCGYEFEAEVGEKLPVVICPRCKNWLNSDEDLAK